MSEDNRAPLGHASSVVLGYSEYGGEGESRQIPPTLGLTMRQQVGEWGLFEYSALGGQRGQGWILMESVQRKE